MKKVEESTAGALLDPSHWGTRPSFLTFRDFNF